MANAILTKYTSAANMTITLASLANATARQSDMITNSSNYGSAKIYVEMTSGATGPTASSTYDIYLLRGNGAGTPYRTDNAGASDAAITIENAKCLGSIVLTNTANKMFYGDFDTKGQGSLGPEWGIAIRNSSGQTVNATGSNFEVSYVYEYPEVQ